MNIASSTSRRGNSQITPTHHPSRRGIPQRFPDHSHTPPESSGDPPTTPRSLPLTTRVVRMSRLARSTLLALQHSTACCSHDKRHPVRLYCPWKTPPPRLGEEASTFLLGWSDGDGGEGGAMSSAAKTVSRARARHRRKFHSQKPKPRAWGSPKHKPSRRGIPYKDSQNLHVTFHSFTVKAARSTRNGCLCATSRGRKLRGGPLRT